MIKKILVIVILSLMVACGSSTPTPPLNTPNDYVNRYGGSMSVYTDLMTSSNCDYLQRTFDRAHKNHTMYYKRGHMNGMRCCGGYMDCADKRMKTIGCYK